MSRNWVRFDVTILAVGCLAIGITVGAGYRDANPYPYFQYQNVKVLRKYAPYHFSLEIAGKQADAYFCSTYEAINGPNGLIAGCLLRDLSYQDHGDCWDVSHPWTGYHYYHGQPGTDLSWDGTICWRAK